MGCKLFALSLALIGAIIFGRVATAKTTVAVGETGQLTWQLNIMLTGPGASAAMAEQWQELIVTNWNDAIAAHSCYGQVGQLDLTAHVDYAGQDDDVILLSDLLEQDFSNFDQVVLEESLSGDYPGYDVWYVPDIAPGQWYRSWTVLGTYQADGIGAISSQAQQGAVLHEAGHLLGMDDHYSDQANGSIPDSDWEDNIMGQSHQSDLALQFSGFAAFTDERNFAEAINTMIQQTGRLVRPCYTVALQVEALRTNGATSTDQFDSAATLVVAPQYPVADAAYALEEGYDALLVSGSGTGQWSPIYRDPQTQFDRFEVLNNPFSVTGSGIIAGSLYTFTIIPQDQTGSFTTDGKQYDLTSTWQGVLPLAQGFCGSQTADLSPMEFDTEQDQPGTICDFSLEGSNVYTGSAQLEILSQE